MAGAPITAGGELEILHTCGMDLGPTSTVNHTTWLPVTRVVRLTDGAFRVEATRCDGTALAVVVDRDGRDVEDGTAYPVRSTVAS